MKPKPKYDYLRAAATHGRQIWPPMAHAKGVMSVPARKPGPVRVLGNAQTLDVRAGATIGTFSRIKYVGLDGIARDPEGAPMLPRIDGGIPVVERTQHVREPTAQRQIVQAAAGHQPTAIAGRRLPSGVTVRILGSANREVPASAAFHKGGKHHDEGNRSRRSRQAPQTARAPDRQARDGQPAPHEEQPASDSGKGQEGQEGKG